MTTPNGGTRDLCGPTGLTTAQFVACVKNRIETNNFTIDPTPTSTPPPPVKDPYEIDLDKIRELFDSLDTNKSGTIDFHEFSKGIKKLGVAPRKIV